MLVSEIENPNGVKPFCLMQAKPSRMECMDVTSFKKGWDGFWCENKIVFALQSLHFLEHCLVDEGLKVPVNQKVCNHSQGAITIATCIYNIIYDQISNWHLSDIMHQKYYLYIILVLGIIHIIFTEYTILKRTTPPTVRPTTAFPHPTQQAGMGPGSLAKERSFPKKLL